MVKKKKEQVNRVRKSPDSQLSSVSREKKECQIITVDRQELTVQYWRAKYVVLFPLFNNLIKLCDELGAHDSEFAGASGFVRLKNVHAGRAGLRLTAKVIGLMEQLSPQIAPTISSHLKRQGIVKRTK